MQRWRDSRCTRRTSDPLDTGVGREGALELLGRRSVQLHWFRARDEVAALGLYRCTRSALDQVTAVARGQDVYRMDALLVEAGDDRQVAVGDDRGVQPV